MPKIIIDDGCCTVQFQVMKAWENSLQNARQQLQNCLDGALKDYTNSQLQTESKYGCRNGGSNCSSYQTIFDNIGYTLESAANAAAWQAKVAGCNALWGPIIAGAYLLWAKAEKDYFTCRVLMCGRGIHMVDPNVGVPTAPGQLPTLPY